MALPLIFFSFILLDSSVLGSLESEFLEAHNSVRSPLGIPDLVWDEEIASFARNYSEYLRDEKQCGLVHSRRMYGENLYTWWGYGIPPMTPAEAVAAWVDEQRYYNYSSNTCQPDQVCGHYTQVVWKHSVFLGCSYLSCDGPNRVLVSCNYYPPGNYYGRRPY